MNHLNLDLTECDALYAVIGYLTPDEQRHWHECGRPREHVYQSVRILQRALKRVDS